MPDYKPSDGSTVAHPTVIALNRWTPCTFYRYILAFSRSAPAWLACNVTNDDSSSNSKDDWSHTEAISMPDRALPGIQNLKHTVVLMMENRFLDHMLEALHGQYPAIDGLAGSETTRT
jgi:hypothetical protein